MRYGRAKAARKTLQFFERTQGLRPPYHILLDGTFVVAMLQYNLPLRDRLDRLLQHAAFQLVVTQSSVDELQRLVEKAPASKQELFVQARDWAQKHCAQTLPSCSNDNEDDDDTQNDNDNDETSTTTNEAVQRLGTAGKDIFRWTRRGLANTAASNHNASKSSSSNNPTDSSTGSRTKEPLHNKIDKYIVASQDEDLLDSLRTAGGVPLIRLARGSVLLLEQPSKAAASQAKKREKNKWTAAVSESERQLVRTVVDHQRQERQKEASANRAPMRRKRKAKQPNPLSCKKKNDEKQDKPKRRRRNKEMSSTDA